ncbi:hypothetical protein [Paracoccus benzoatiresistens]|uniref:Uncharacterized protein n=1 Tax=Paracoccus benzoatiresistens TaxID=2997341 RepID=A0ABT4JA28_9RHOB|nr:hypothetical protein [Paracoccus sp. EF6]MCZ0963925.1 hypothetical protein [Paracoccus sp. EF6]
MLLVVKGMREPILSAGWLKKLHPEILLHTNASENDLRACVTKRRISGGPMSGDGRQAGDIMLELMKTCRKLGISFFAYLGDRLGFNATAERILPLPDVVGAQPA